MGFGSYKALVDAIDADGKRRIFSYRKTPAQATTSGIWTDLSMSPGNPVPNYYASTPLLAATLNGGEGFFHGSAVTPSTKHLKEFLIYSNSATGLPASFMLCDYLLYYPFIDQGSTDIQTLDNSVTLPRYTTGAGVQCIAVLVAAQSGGQSFNISYTNQDGTAGRTSGTVICNTATSSGTLVNTQTANALQAGPFIPLQGTDTGIRSIESLTMLGADVGLITLVLVKPLASFILRGVDAAVEVDFMKDRPSMPQIVDGAYLNLLALPTGSLSGVSLFGTLTTVWS